MNFVKSCRSSVLLCLIVNLVTGQQPSAGSNGFTLEIFNNTKVTALAKAVDLQDTKAIEVIVSHDRSLLDFREAKFGHTVLLVGAFNSKIVSVEKLLELGASPNIRSKHDSNPFLTVCFYAMQIDSARKLMQLMISHGADVNATQIDTSLDQFGKPLHFRASALEIGVTYGTLEVVKTLLENGATLSAYPKNEGSIVASAVLAGDIDIIEYLIVEKHAPLPDYCVIRQQGTAREKKMTISDLITEPNYIVNPTQHQSEQRQKIIDFLRAHGKR